MKKILALFVVLNGILGNSNAQKIGYTTILKLNPGEDVINLLSCWKPDASGMPTLIVISCPDKTYSTLTGGIRKDHLTYNEVATSGCNSSLKAPHDSHARFGRLLPDGQWNIRSEKKDYGTYTNIHFMRESGDRFVAVVSLGKERAAQYFFLDSDGQKTLLDGRPESLVTNDDLSRSAVVLADSQAPTAGEINKLSREEQIAYFDKKHRTDLTRQVWLNDNRVLTVQRKSRLFFDPAGRHFIEVQPQVFYIDGKAWQRNISDTRTQLYVSPDGTDWAYFVNIYMGFRNNTNFQNVFQPFLTTEEGKECLNWFAVQKENNTMVVKLCKRRW